MQVIKETPRFSEKTGKQIGTSKTAVGWVCDYCGKFHSEDEEPASSYLGYRTVEPNDIERAEFHEYRVSGFPDVDVYDLYDAHPEFRYCHNRHNPDGNTTCETDMLFSYMKGEEKADGHFLCLAVMLYEARVKMLVKLLKAKTYTLEELNLG